MSVRVNYNSSQKQNYSFFLAVNQYIQVPFLFAIMSKTSTDDINQLILKTGQGIDKLTKAF